MEKNVRILMLQKEKSELLNKIIIAKGVKNGLQKEKIIVIVITNHVPLIMVLQGYSFGELVPVFLC